MKTELTSITNMIVKRPGEIVGKPNDAMMSDFACARCKFILRNIETIRRADGNVLQLMTCTELILTQAATIS